VRVILTSTHDGTHRISTTSPLTFKSLSYLGNKYCIPVYKESVLRICSQELTACFRLASLANFE